MMKYLLTTLVLFAFVFSAQAQKKPYLTEKKKIEEAAISELDASAQSGELKEFAEKNNIKGEFYYDLTITGKKAHIITVFSLGNDMDDVKAQNKLKDFLKEVTFNFKVPKDKRYKFEYTLTLD